MTLNHRSNEQLRELLGVRLRAFRKSRGLTQAEIAERSGLSRPTVSALERGNEVGLDSFLSVLRALDLLDALDITVPEPALSPIGELPRRSGTVSSVRGEGRAPDWSWGDET